MSYKTTRSKRAKRIHPTKKKTLYGMRVKGGRVMNARITPIQATPVLKGEDATVYIKPPSISSDDSNPGIQLIRSTNNFSLDGINYSLNSETDDYLNLNLTSNPQKTFDKIKEFAKDKNGNPTANYNVIKDISTAKALLEALKLLEVQG
jgi:hypothetical protein